MTRRVDWLVVMAVCAAALAGAVGPASAQHIAPPQGVRGGVIPAAYFQRLASDPTAFTLPNGLFRADADGLPMAGETFGTKGLIVLPALFSDSPVPSVSQVAIDQALFTGPATRGTLTAAYTEMSRDLFTVTGQVLPWVRTTLTLAQVVGVSNGLGEEARVGDYLIEALRLADPAVDFGQYDNDGPDGLPNSGDDDGIVDAIAFEFIEVAGSCGGPGIWPHQWGVAAYNEGLPYYTDDLRPGGDSVGVNGYIVQSALDCDGVTIQSAATIAHEFGHVLGLPDYYHPTALGGAAGRRWVLGCWELMAAGSWGCGPHGSTRDAFGPTHFSARTLNSLGWLSYVTLGEVWNEEIVLDPVELSGEALRIPLDDTGREFLLVEYRTQTGFDRDIPAEGVLVYHQDFQGEFRPNPEGGSSYPYFLSVLEQDDNKGLIRNSYEGGNRGEAGDAWGVGGAVQKLTAATRPALLRNNGQTSTVAFHSIEVVDGKAHINISTSRTPHVVAPTGPLAVTQVTPFEERIRVAGGAMPYQVTATLPPGVTATAEGDELVLRGSVTGPGPFELSLRVADSHGVPSDAHLVLMTAGAWVVSEDRLFEALLTAPAHPLSAVELSYLDAVGNRNGRYDVGDLRAWVRNHPNP